MFICLYEETENPPECYFSWPGVLRWAEMSLKNAMVAEEEWPFAFAPHWFHEAMVPNKPLTFRPVFEEESVVAIVIETLMLYSCSIRYLKYFNSKKEISDLQ